MPAATTATAILRHRTALRRALLGWFEQNRRPLPWRTAPSLYGTVVSEFMLQQTQVKTVLPYFERWRIQFPDFKALARAGETAVLRAWEGLGYYSRARNLHRLAQAIAARPALPRTAAEWRELPGIGPYTAAAIASIAGGEAAACVDGNIVRVLARLTATRRSFAPGGAAAKHFAPLATALLDPRRPGAYNEAIMELGALVCLPRTPRCGSCPLARWCRARAQGHAEKIPRLERRKTERRRVDRVWCEHAGALLLRRVDGGARRLAGLHELPLADELALPAGRREAAPVLLRRRRGITHHVIEERILKIDGVDPAGFAAGPALLWQPLDQLAHLPLSGPHRRWIAEILGERAL